MKTNMGVTSLISAMKWLSIQFALQIYYSFDILGTTNNNGYGQLLLLKDVFMIRLRHIKRMEPI
jgi:hypothetical protein